MVDEINILEAASGHSDFRQWIVDCWTEYTVDQLFVYVVPTLTFPQDLLTFSTRTEDERILNSRKQVSVVSTHSMSPAIQVTSKYLGISLLLCLQEYLGPVLYHSYDANVAKKLCKSVLRKYLNVFMAKL